MYTVGHCRFGVFSTLLAISAWHLTTTSSQLCAHPFSGLVVFGDSNSDVGNWAIDAGLPDGEIGYPYYRGRISNGPIWVEILAQHLDLPELTPSLAGGTNYAWSGGTTGSVPGEDVNMDELVENYLSHHAPGPDELFVMWGGANDFSEGQTDVHAPVNYLIDQISVIAEAGARSFLVVNLPRYFGSLSANSRLTPHVDAFNAELSTALMELRGTHRELTLVEFNYFELFENVASDPSAYGFQNMIGPACRSCYGANPVVVKNHDEYYFWDEAHATSRAHQLIGDAAFAVLVPEPSSFVMTSMVLAFVARHRRSRSRRYRRHDPNYLLVFAFRNRGRWP